MSVSHTTKSRLLLYGMLVAAAALLAASLGGQDAGPEAPPFGQRTGFQPLSIEAPPLRARRAGAAAEDVYALPVQALGAVAGRAVADIGAGRGRHLAAIAGRLGAEGRLFATEIGDAGCEVLRGVVAAAGLERVSVVRAEPDDVGLAEDSIDVALLSDVYQFVTLQDGERGQDRHGFLTSLQRALVPGGEVVVTYVTSSELRREDTREALLRRTLHDFRNYGFEVGRRWVLDGPHWPLHVLEFRWPADGPVSPGTYLGREIARTMHWMGADWLVRPEREQEEDSRRMLAALGLEPGMTVADFGCGNGYYTLDMARRVGAGSDPGRVLGVDIQVEMLDMLERRASEAGLENVEPVLGSTFGTGLPPASCDLILLADVYHELSHPVASLAALRRALKPEGRIAVLEFRAEDPDVPIKPDHKMSRDQVLLEFGSNGFELAGEMDELPWQHLLFFRPR